MRGEEATGASTLDNLSSWLRQSEMDESFNHRDTVHNVEPPAFPEKVFDIFHPRTHGTRVIW